MLLFGPFGASVAPRSSVGLRVEGSGLQDTPNGKVTAAVQKTSVQSPKKHSRLAFFA